MNSVVKGMVLILLVLYILSPVDLCPGPVDDLIVLLLAVAGGGAKKVISED